MSRIEGWRQLDFCRKLQRHSCIFARLTNNFSLSPISRRRNENGIIPNSEAIQPRIFGDRERREMSLPVDWRNSHINLRMGEPNNIPDRFAFPPYDRMDWSWLFLSKKKPSGVVNNLIKNKNAKNYNSFFSRDGQYLDGAGSTAWFRLWRLAWVDLCDVISRLASTDWLRSSANE